LPFLLVIDFESQHDTLLWTLNNFHDLKSKESPQQQFSLLFEQQVFFLLQGFSHCYNTNIKLTEFKDGIDLDLTNFPLPNEHTLYFLTQESCEEYRISLCELIRILFISLVYEMERKEKIHTLLVHNVRTLQITEINMSKWKQAQPFHLYLKEKFKI